MVKTLSVVIPAYNVENLIGRTLFSLLSQNSSSIEIIVVNDGSTDQTEEAVRKTIESSSIQNISLYTKTNGGVSSARNYGLDRAEGSFVFFLDGDDYVAEGFVGRILELIGREEPQIIHWPYDMVAETGEMIAGFPYSVLMAANKTGIETLNAILLEKSTRIWTGSIAYRRAFLTENGIRYTSGCAVGEDLEFIFKSLSFAQTVLFTDQLRSFYLQRPASAMNAYSIKRFDAVLALSRVREHFLRINAPEYKRLAKHVDEYEILHYYTGTYRMCLQYLISDQKMRAPAAIQHLSGEIDRLYPGMREDISSKMKTRGRRILPDRIDVFRFSPLLYMYLSRFSVRTKLRA